MKEKIIIALRAKYGNMGLSDKALLGIASMLAITTTDEANIETAVAAEGVVEALKGIQAEGDLRAQKERDKSKDKPPVPPVDPNNPNPPKDPVNETPTEKMLREVFELVKAQAAEIAAIKGGKTIETRKEALLGKLKDAPDAFKETILESFELMSFKDDEAFTGYLTKLEPRITAVKQESNNAELTGIKAPVMGNPNADGVSSNVAAYVERKAAEAKPGGDLGGKKI